MPSSKKTYTIDGQPMTFEQIRAHIDANHPHASRVSDTLLRRRLQNTMRMDRLAEDPALSLARTRDKYRRQTMAPSIDKARNQQ